MKRDCPECGADLMPLIRAGRAQELRDAADDWVAGEWRPVNFNKAGRDEHPGARQARWMRERADRIEQEDK